MTVDGTFVGLFVPKNTTPQILLIASHGDKVYSKLKLRAKESWSRFFIFGTTPAVPQGKRIA